MPNLEEKLHAKGLFMDQIRKRNAEDIIQSFPFSGNVKVPL